MPNNTTIHNNRNNTNINDNYSNTSDKKNCKRKQRDEDMQQPKFLQPAPSGSHDEQTEQLGSIQNKRINEDIITFYLPEALRCSSHSDSRDIMTL